VRIVELADSFDAMTSARPYRGPLSVGSALSDLVRTAEKFDPNAVQALVSRGKGYLTEPIPLEDDRRCKASVSQFPRS